MKLMNCKRVLAIGAHPDDIEYGCFGLLRKLKTTGAEIAVFVASEGSAGDPTSGPARVAESRLALDLLPTTLSVFRAEKGCEAAQFGSISDSLYKLIQEFKPDLILTLSAHDSHQEHRLVHEMTLAAGRRSRASILSYGILSNTLQFSPTVFVDVAEELPEKKRAIACHRTQKDKTYMSESYLEIFHSHKYANLHGLRYTEAYEVVRIFI